MKQLVSQRRNTMDNSIDSNINVNQRDQYIPPTPPARSAFRGIPYRRNKHPIRRSRLVNKLDAFFHLTRDSSAALYSLEGPQKTQITVDSADRPSKDNTWSTCWPNTDSEATLNHDLPLEELRGLPLAILRVRECVQRASSLVSDSLSRMVHGRERPELFMAGFHLYPRPDVPDSILETLKTSIDRIRVENEVAYRILHVIAYFDIQDISFEIIKEASSSSETKFTGGAEEFEATRAMARLVEFSLVTERKIEDGGCSYQMHKLVQEGTRYWLNVRESAQRRTWRVRVIGRGEMKNGGEAYFSNIALQIITRLFPSPTPETWAQCDKYLAHALQVVKLATRVDVFELHRFLCRVTIFLYHRCKWREKEALDMMLLNINQEFVGEKHPNMARCMQCLAKTYLNQGRYNEAEKMQNMALEVFSEALGDENRETIDGLGVLATIFLQQRRCEEAEAMTARVLKLQREILGHKHADTIVSMGNMAATLAVTGRHEEAEELFVEVYELSKEVYGERDETTLKTKRNIADLYRLRGKYREAEEMLLEAMQVQTEIFGEKHTDTIHTMDNLVSTYWQLGRRLKAEEMAAKALELQRVVCGEMHPDTFHYMHHLSCIWHHLGRVDEAISLEEECFRHARLVLGEDHPSTQSFARTLELWKRLLAFAKDHI